MDARVFATTKTNLLTNQAILNPVRFDENGADVGEVLIATGSNEDGTHAFSCTDWTSTTTSFEGGYSMGGPGSWGSNTGVGGCSSSWRLLCLGKTMTATPTVSTFAGKKVWLTNTTAAIAAGFSPDTACNTDRPAGVASGKAFVSTTMASAGSKLTAAQMYVRPDGQEVGTGTEITSNLARAGVWQFGNATYLNTAAGDSFRVWTGGAINSAGTVTTTCNDWVDSAGTGQQGLLERSRATTAITGASCSGTGTNAARLYCYEP